MKYIIDRIEGTIAICEDDNKNVVKIPKYKLPLEVKAGDTIVEHDGFLKVDNKGILGTKKR